MAKRTVVVASWGGLHARPAAGFVKRVLAVTLLETDLERSGPIHPVEESCLWPEEAVDRRRTVAGGGLCPQ